MPEPPLADEVKLKDLVEQYGPVEPAFTVGAVLAPTVTETPLLAAQPTASVTVSV